jgi:hypothetical protein
LRKHSLRLEPVASEVKGKCANHLATEAHSENVVNMKMKKKTMKMLPLKQHENVVNIKINNMKMKKK